VGRQGKKLVRSVTGIIAGVKFFETNREYFIHHLLDV
jgi:hypothetical protein